MTKDYNLIKKCLLQIEEKLEWGSSDTWHNEVFLELSNTVQDQTNVLLSPTTLKRVWGKVNYNSNPSINTLNTLAQFSGYLNWRDFKNNYESKPIVNKVVKFPYSRLKILGVTLVLAVSIASFIIGMRSKVIENIKHDFANVTFSSRSVASGLPNSVVFDFDLKGIISDSIYIQQFWDKTKTIKINAHQSQATGQYYYPGYYRAKLLVDGVIGKEHDLFIKSKGWLGTIEYEPIPKYFNELSFKHILKLPESAQNEISQQDKPLVSSFHYVDDLGEISGDNFLLDTSIRNAYNDKWAVCSSSRIVILGTKGAMIIPFSIPGCVSEIGLMMNDVYLSGKEHDLSMFGTDLSQFNKIKVRVEDKKVSVVLNGKKIYSGKYNATMGNVVGLRYRFLGAGEVNHLILKDLTNDSLIAKEGIKIGMPL